MAAETFWIFLCIFKDFMYFEIWKTAQPEIQIHWYSFWLTCLKCPSLSEKMKPLVCNIFHLHWNSEESFCFLSIHYIFNGDKRSEVNYLWIVFEEEKKTIIRMSSNKANFCAVAYNEHGALVRNTKLLLKLVSPPR